MKINKLFFFFLLCVLLISCKKDTQMAEVEKEKAELSSLLNEKPLSESETINEKLVRLIKASRENVEAREELIKKIEAENGDFTAETKIKFQEFVDNDGIFSQNPRNVDAIVEIDNIEWDITDEIRVLKFTEKFLEAGKLKLQQEVQMAFKVVNDGKGNITIQDFAYEIQKIGT